MLMFVRSFVRLSDEKCSRALNLHLSLSGQSQVSPRLVPGQSQVSPRSVPGLSQVCLRSVSVCLRSVSGLSQVSLRSVSGHKALFAVESEPKILRLVCSVIL